MKTISLLTFVLLSVSGNLAAQINISFDIQLEVIKDSLGNPVDPTTQYFLVADTNNDGFNFASNVAIGTNSGNLLSEGLFFDGVSGDDLILWRDDETENSPITGFYSDLTSTLTTGTYGEATWNDGDDLAIVWFPEYTSLTSTVMAGDEFGLFSPSVTTIGDAWTTPNVGSGGYALYALTTDAIIIPSDEIFGTLDPNTFLAANAIPEPSTYALIVGLGSLLLVFWRRKINKG